MTPDEQKRAAAATTNEPNGPVHKARPVSKIEPGNGNNSAGSSNDTATSAEPPDQFGRAQDEVSYATLPTPARTHGPSEAFDGIADFLGFPSTKPKVPR